MHAKSGGSCGEPPDFLFIPAACRSRKDLPRSAGGGDRARNTGNRPRDAEDGATGTGAGCGARARAHGHGRRRRVRGRGCGVRGAGRGARVRNTEDAGVGRRTQNAERGTRKTWTRARARGAGDGRRETGHRRRGTSPRAWNATRPHTPRQAPQQPAWTVHSRAPSAAGTNPPGPFTAGRPPPGPATTRRGHSQPGAIRHRDLQQPAGAVHSRAPSAAGRRYLSRVRIRITPLPPRTPYMLLPRCTSTDLTS